MLAYGMRFSCMAKTVNHTGNNIIRSNVAYTKSIAKFLCISSSSISLFFYPTRSVLKPPVPVEEYLREQQERQSQTIVNQFDIKAIRSASAGTPQQQQMVLSPQLPSIRDSDSLRTLLPKAHKHLLGN